MTFDNALLDIETNEDNIEDAFDAAFPDWKFSIDKTEEIKSSNSKTKIDCHFLQRDNFDPVLKTINQSDNSPCQNEAAEAAAEGRRPEVDGLLTFKCLFMTEYINIYVDMPVYA